MRPIFPHLNGPNVRVSLNEYIHSVKQFSLSVSHHSQWEILLAVAACQLVFAV